MYQIYKLQIIGLLLDMRSKIQGGLNFLKKLEIENLTLAFSEMVGNVVLLGGTKYATLDFVI